MKEKNLFSKSLALLGILTMLFAAAYATAAETAATVPAVTAPATTAPAATTPAATAVPVAAVPVSVDPSLKGAFTKCSYKPPQNPGYMVAEVWYPCETVKGPFAATTLMAGYLNSHDDMRWLAYHLVTHGYIIFTMTPTDVMGNTPLWTEAHKAGIAMLKSENTRNDSKIKGLVDINKLQLMGYGKGGAGALLAAVSLGSEVKATQAMAPYMDDSYDLEGIKSATICYAGRNDETSPPGKVVSMYKDFSFEKALAYLKNFPYSDWSNTGDAFNQNHAKIYITSWMKYYLDGDKNYETYLYGEQHESHMKADWFYDFRHATK